MKKPNYVFDDELYHWGILGQKWGTRRFQNEDGSLTAEGRERYGVGDKERIKIEKAKATYNTQKYKADLKSKAQMEKDVRSAKEERNRIKENSKTMLLARKKQSKFDILNKKENAKLENQGRPKSGFGKTKNMSDEELAKAIDRLKLQAEYNKQYVLATQPNSTLVKADRFFEGPTGKMVRDIAVATIPSLVTQSASKILDSGLRYANPLDRQAQEALINRTNTETAERQANIQKTLSDMDLNVRKANVDMAEKRSTISKNYADIADKQASRAKTISDQNLNIRKANVEMAEKRSNISKNYAEIDAKRAEAQSAAAINREKLKAIKEIKDPVERLNRLNQNQSSKKKKK